MSEAYKKFSLYLILSHSIPFYPMLPYPFFLLRSTAHCVNFKTTNSIPCSLKNNVLEIFRCPDEYRIKDKMTEELIASNMTQFPFTLSRVQNLHVWLWSKFWGGEAFVSCVSSLSTKPNYHLCPLLPCRWGKGHREHFTSSLTAFGSKDSKLPLWCILGTMWYYVKINRDQWGEIKTLCSSCQSELSLSCEMVTWHIGSLLCMLLTEADAEWSNLHSLVQCPVYHSRIKLTKIIGFSEYWLFRILLRA